MDFWRVSLNLISRGVLALGLVLAAWIVAHHHTKGELESEVGAGSRFSWRLPLAPPLEVTLESASQKSELHPLVSASRARVQGSVLCDRNPSFFCL